MNEAELTMDEVRRACEAVGWGTVEVPGGLVVRSPDGGFGWLALRRSKLRALALLEATGEDFEVACHQGHGATKWTAGIIRTGEQHIEDNFPEAAVRAVLAWADDEPVPSNQQ